jgi:hypothetical protein
MGNNGLAGRFQPALRNNLSKCSSNSTGAKIMTRSRAKSCRRDSQSGLVSGYLFDLQPAISSDIIAFHEPITGALPQRAAGGDNPGWVLGGASHLHGKA